MGKPLYDDPPLATNPRDSMFAAKDLNELKTKQLLQWSLNSKLLCLVSRKLNSEGLFSHACTYMYMHVCIYVHVHAQPAENEKNKTKY